ncbi:MULTISPECIES: FMN-dependent NADH-azoreductase [Paraburkholderia]|uniref:FMN dependent NADH:quinone oxidoreductase n=1 Tax=Paraburkholderia madseniana TaxID=2599607 RepID=A0AAP5BL33_9BURK|nr:MULTISPECIES: NAD(P)H-dependent oxidoreductase [Paraburkholderia]MCX4149951.1 NAD(P)H-dependent oxidoreductase [Paraburkholderia madseniana]MDN7152887.1 NAD(P)H-dependent oxidoreductase [Paraburkholderia sp. WS6]MDQ6411769.1 NAD(P)H-dependent oxidoreductase [Paraburkholderia madseniana]
MKLLHIDSSITGAQSVTRQLSAIVVSRLEKTATSLSITYRDLAAEPVPHQSPSIQFAKLKELHDIGALSGDIGEMVDAALKEGAKVEPSAQVEFAETNVALEEFLEADVIVIGAPMYNFGVPSQLKAWIDCLAVPGKTFNYTATGVEGLAGAKRVIIASSRGGIYSESSPIAAMDHQEPFLKSFFSFIGVTDITFVRAEGVSIGPEQRQQALDSALVAAAAL